METLTVFTPTFNRASFLRRLYCSLLLQKKNFFNFTWLIIDDGSTDNTKEIVNSFIEENKISITYYYQENSGKQAAINKALSMCNTTFFVVIDSDDYFTNNAFETFNISLNKLTSDSKLCAARFNMVRLSNGIIDNKPYDENPKVMSYFEALCKNDTGERIELWKTDLVKSCPYPVTEEIRFIPESYKLINLSAKGFNYLYYNDIVAEFDDCHNNSHLSKSSIYDHARGHYIYRSAVLKLTPHFVFRKKPIFYIKSLIRFSQVANFLHLSFAERKKDSTSTFAALVSFSLGALKV